MKHVHEKEIDGRSWAVQEFGATEGLKVLANLMRLLGKPLGSVLAGLRTADAQIDMTLLGHAVGELAERLHEDEVVKLVKRILAETRCDGVEVGKAFDVIFQRAYGTLLKVVLFAVEANFDVPLAGLLESLPSGGGGAALTRAQP